MSQALQRKNLANEALLDAAERLFIARGFTAVSTRDLAEEAEVNLAAIQYHFGSKAQLFVESVRRMMARKEHKSPFVILAAVDKDRRASAARFCTFVRRFLYELANPSGPDVCRMIFREALGELSEEPQILEALVSTVVEEFHRPSFDLLYNNLQTIAPDLAPPRLELIAQGVLAHCTFYKTHEPFLGRMTRWVIADDSSREQIAQHICFSTLGQLGLCRAVAESSWNLAAGISDLEIQEDLDQVERKIASTLELVS